MPVHANACQCNRYSMFARMRSHVFHVFHVAGVTYNQSKCCPVVQDQNVPCVSLFDEDDEAPNKYVIEASDLLALAWSEGIKAIAKL